MIISHRHRYLFVETPHTASTAIARELVELYDGQKILHKHASYGEFRRVATAEERRYFVFAGSRHPFDTTVTVYFRIASDHKGRYSRPGPLSHTSAHYQDEIEEFHWIRSRGADFATWFLGNIWLPYDDWLTSDAGHFDAIIRFEHLQEDFAGVLARLGIEQARPLPRENQTAQRSTDFLAYYTPATRRRAAWVFGPYLERRGLQFPPEWGDMAVPRRARLLFRLLQPLRGYFRDHRFGVRGAIIGQLRNRLLAAIKRRERPRLRDGAGS